MVWQLRGAVREERETCALRLVADLVSQHRPGQSTAGLVVTAAALVVMLLFALAKRRTGHRPGQYRAQRLAGMVVADPAAAPVIAGLAVREGIEA